MAQQQPDGGLRSDLVDLSGVDFDLLDELPASVLARSLERVRRDNTSTADHYASFQNRI
jgi:FXSXX-COOH protein